GLGLGLLAGGVLGSEAVPADVLDPASLARVTPAHDVPPAVGVAVLPGQVLVEIPLLPLHGDRELRNLGALHRLMLLDDPQALREGVTVGELAMLSGVPDVPGGRLQPPQAYSP